MPSLSLQRVRLRLDYLTALERDDGDSSAPPFLTETDGSYAVDTAAASAYVRAAERDGVMSSVTALGGLKLEAEEDRARQERERGEKGRGRWSSSSGSAWGSGSGSGSSGGAGLLGSLTSWLTGGVGDGKKKP